MNHKVNILDQINPAYFWDVNRVNMDADKSKRLIIERVFSLGKLEEIRLLLNYYGKDQTLKVLMGLNYLDPKTLNFISGLFRISITDFKCYTRTRSQNLHLNF